MNWIDTFILLFIIFMFLLNFLPYLEGGSESAVLFVNYGIALVALYESIIHGQWKFVSLVTTSMLIHIITDSCKVGEACISEYNKANYESLEKYFTLYGLLHLIAYGSLSTRMVEIFVPLLVLVSLLAVNLEIDSLALAVIGIVCFINLITKKHHYHLEDTIVFVLFMFLASLFYFLKEDEDKVANVEGNGLKRFFIFFYFLAFSVSTAIKKEGIIHSLRLFTRWCGGAEQRREDVVILKPMYQKVSTQETQIRMDLFKTS